jgi:hypothetical protein
MHVSRLIQRKNPLSSIEIPLYPAIVRQNVCFMYFSSQACHLEDVVLMEEAPVAFPKDVLVQLVRAPEGLG